MTKSFTITIPETLFNFLSDRADTRNCFIDDLITRALDQFYYEYDDNYPWIQVKKEIEGDN